MYLQLKWTGKAVGENRRLCPGKSRWYQNADYRAFLDGMTILFRAQAGGIVFNQPDILICAKVGALVDDQNLFKPVLDAIERAGIVDNDRNIGWKRMAPPERHPQGQDDEIMILITGDGYVPPKA